MAKKINNIDFFFGFFIVFFISLGFVVVLDIERKRKKRLEDIKKRLNSGFEQDRLNLLGDWNNVYNDIEKSYNEQKSQYEPVR